VSIALAATLAGLAGLLVGLLLPVARRAARRSVTVRPRAPVGGSPRPGSISLAILDELPLPALAVDGSDSVVLANRAARRHGLVAAGRLPSAQLRALVRQVRRTGAVRRARLSVPAADLLHTPVPYLVQGFPLDSDRPGEIALLAQDMTEADRVEAVRRDFVANVGHEIKTPVGALSLLAEAALDARDDPDAVAHFVTRIHHEAQRLGRLVQEVIELSRLQGADPLPDLDDVALDDVVVEAADRVRSAADARRISIEVGGDRGVVVRGSRVQLVTAVANLLDNAVAYSPELTAVAVGVHARDGAVEVAVRDEGPGIPREFHDRVFERFFRVDPARSRATGGTGLGLSIVKHIMSNHGGEVVLWSREGAGSTFTLRLPTSSLEDAVPDELAGDVPDVRSGGVSDGVSGGVSGEVSGEVPA
jgi:two-component system sensor histidine kinase SenX3